jgi:small GTP-binding protein
MKVAPPVYTPSKQTATRKYSLQDLKRVEYTGETLRRVLSPDQNKILCKEVAIIEDIRFDLAALHAEKDDIELLKRSLEQLEDLFMLVIVGEFNSGKSSFLNALLGKKYLKEGVTPTTNKINILKYGPEVQTNVEVDTEYVQLPVDWLKEISLVDTPGTNAVITGHQKLTEHFVPRSDMVLFVTSTDRAFSESERIFLDHIKQWKKKVLVVLSKSDLLEDPNQLNEVAQFVSVNFKTLLGIDPVIFPVSSKLALRAKTDIKDPTVLATDAGWKKSNFGELEKYIQENLDGGQRAKLKMTNPLGVADHIVSQYVTNIDSQMSIIRADMEVLDHINNQLNTYRGEMLREFDTQITKIENCLLKMRDRADNFFDEKLRLANAFGLLKADSLRADFVRGVVGDTSRDIDRHVGDVIDWLVDKNFRQWQNISEYMSHRPSLKSDKIVGTVPTSGHFLLNRANLIDSIGSAATEAINSYDKHKEAGKLIEEMRGALFQTAAVEVGAVGIATVLVTSLLDFTGIIGAGVVAVVGMGILPYKRSAIKKLMRVRIAELQERVNAALESHFTRELENSVAKIRDTLSPYSTFVKTEHEKLEKMQTKFHSHVANLQKLRLDIDAAFK